MASQAPPLRGSPTSAAAFVAAGMLSLLALASPAVAAHRYVVDGSGGGDFTSLATAIDSLLAQQSASLTPDSIVVRPGYYDESATLAQPPLHSAVILCPQGPMVTRLRAFLVSGTLNGSPGWSIDGLGVAQRLNTSATRFTYWSHCIFESGFVSQNGTCAGPNLANCEFRGRTILDGYANSGAFVGLHFKGAPLYAGTASCGDVSYRDCTFEGPADTLVTAAPVGGENPLHFARCDFSNAVNGIVVIPGTEGDNSVEQCRFSHLTGAAIWLDQPFGVAQHSRPFTMNTSDSRFDSCGTAVHWLTGFSGGQQMSRDTISNCTGNGVVVTAGADWRPAFSDLLIQGCGGNGFELEVRPFWVSASVATAGGVQLVRLTARGNQGDGVVVRDTINAGTRRGVWLLSSIASGNGGAGFRVGSARCTMAGNVSLSNASDGITFTTTRTGWLDSLTSNTCASNGGDGIRLSRPGVIGPAPQVVQHDLVAFNTGAGIRTTVSHDGSVAFNDSWLNADNAYVGLASPLDSNLTTNPRFCGLSLGDVRLEFGSPCGAAGQYGLIGAKPEACAGAGVPPGITGITFSAGPNPARGAVTFAIPAGEGEAQVEVFDVQGRLVWSRNAKLGESLRWAPGDGVGGAAPGLYLARFARGNERRFVRVVRIE